MDCLFNDNEVKEMLIYAKELQNNNLHPIMYVAQDWNFVNSSWTSAFAPPLPTHHNNGCIGAYYGMPVYAFEGLDSHTCCILPNYNEQPF